MITYTYDLDVTPGGVPLSVHASQYDGDSRTFVFRLFSSAGEKSPESHIIQQYSRGQLILLGQEFPEKAGTDIERR